MKLLFVGCLLVTVNAAGQGQKISLEDIERDYYNEKSSSYVQPKASGSVPSPTKFGFVPLRTAASYAATKPKQTNTQSNYRVKQPSAKQPTPYQHQYVNQYSQQPFEYQQQYTNQYNQQYTEPEKYPAPVSSSDYSQQYSTGSQQYPQQQLQQYTYAQPDVKQYEQPAQQYEQYQNVQYISDNSVAQDGQQYYAQAPQYYYVQQYQSPSTAVESVIDPKAAVQYVYVPSYSPNSIPMEQKYQESYSNYELPPTTTSVKYTAAIPRKYSSKQHVSQKEVHYVQPAAKTQYHKQDENIFNREPKSLLDSYIPSIVQLKYLEQQKNGRNH